MFKTTISLPGLVTSWLFVVEGGGSKDHQPVALINRSCADLYRLIRDNLVGGPSIVFHRYHEKGVTKLRERQYGKCAETYNTILGVDVNPLYLCCITQEMHSGHPAIREAEDGFAIRQELTGCSKDAFAWLEHMSGESNVVIRHRRIWGEKRIGRHGLLADGFDEQNNTVYQFYGCYWQGQPCQRRVDPHPHKQLPLADVYEDILQKPKYIKSLGYRVVSVWKWEWRARCKRDRRVA